MKILLKILFLPLLILWILIVPLFKLLNKVYDATIWNWKGVYLIDSSKELKLKIEDKTEGSVAFINIYYNNPVKKKFLYIQAINKDVDSKVNINTDLNNLKREVKNNS